MPHAGKDTTVKLTGTATAMANEACTELSPTVFQVTDAARRILDPAATFVVRVNTVVEPVANYTLDHLFGTITFVGSETGNTIDITGDFLPTHDVAEARTVSASFGRDMEDSTIIGNDAHAMTALLQTFSASLERLEFGLDDIDPGGGVLRTADLVRNGTPKLLEINLDGTTGYRAWFKAESEEPGFAQDNLVSSSLSVVGDLQNGADNVWGHGTF